MSDWFEIPFGVKCVNAQPVDARRFNNNDEPYANTAEVLAQNPAPIRIPNQIYDVYDGLGGVVMYYFKDGVADEDLIQILEEDIDTFIRTTGDQDIDGTLTVTRGYTDNETPIDTNELTSKGYVDSTFVKLTGNQDINGELTATKFFTDTNTPTALNELTSKEYVDSGLSSKLGNTGNQTITGYLNTYGIIPRTLPWAEIVALLPSNIYVGNAFIVSDQSNKQILITGKSTDGSFWYKDIDNYGVETINKVE